MKALFKKYASIAMELPRFAKRAIFLAIDVSLCVIAAWSAFYLRVGVVYEFSDLGLQLATLTSVLIAIPIFIATGLYLTIFRFNGLATMVTVVRATVLYGVIYASIFTAFGVNGVPRTVGLIQPFLMLILLVGSRVAPPIWLNTHRRTSRRPIDARVLIYGAGSAGRQLAAALKASAEVVLVGLMDDDERLHGNVMNGLMVYNPADMRDVISKLQVNQLYLAIPSVSRARRNEILETVRGAQVVVRTLPNVMDLANGKVHASDLKELDIEDLLGRDPVPPDVQMLSKNIASKVVMVTGAGGSIGSELCRQIVKANPSTLLLIESSEFALYAIHQELSQLTDITLLPLLANVQDQSRMAEIFRVWRPVTVYHAAAYKHVPLVEHNPAEGIRNNVFGTLITATQAKQYGVEDFVLISTDKAVRPTNVMGASKRLAEMVLQAQANLGASHGGGTRFSMVRFGNVLGSSGSVVPLFRQQIAAGGPITLTDPRITRYFMTIPEAAQLVIQAGAMASGGDVFVLDMGHPLKIIDLAKRMIELSGFQLKDEVNPKGDIEIAVTGLRPGEKLYEELLIGDNPLPTGHARIMRANEEFLAWDDLEEKLDELTRALNSNDAPVYLNLMKQLVFGYKPEGAVVDWVWMFGEKVG
jgi:FlaA1/EpsC-like NDP-sugar epimerase